MKIPSKASIVAKLIPYKAELLLALVVIVLSTVFVLGMKLQAKWDDGALARKDTVIVQQKGELKQAKMAIDAAAVALKAQAQANKEALARERASKLQAIEAGKVVEDARYRAQKRANELQRKLDAAKKIDVCRLLLTTDINKECKL